MCVCVCVCVTVDAHLSLVLTAASSSSSSFESPKFGLPRVYDKSYRISISVVTPDLAYKLRRVQERREDSGRGESPLSMEHLSEFRTVLRHFVNFLQKQKVLMTSLCCWCYCHPKLVGSELKIHFHAVRQAGQDSS